MNWNLIKRRRIISIVLATSLLLTAVSSSDAIAADLKNLQNEKKAAENKKNSLNSTIQEKKIQIEAKQSKADQLIKQVKLLNEKIEETNTKMDGIITEMNKTKREINVLEASILELEYRIAERDEILRERVRVMQVKGGKVSYIDVLLGANSFTDFIDRFSAVTTLMDADRKIIQQQEEDMIQLEEQKELVEQKLAEQGERQLKIQALKDELLEKKSEKRELVRILEEEQERLSAEKTSLEEEYDDTIKISEKLESKIIAEQNRLAEIARQEQARKLALTQDLSIPVGELPVISSGFWTTPTKGKYSSGFGWRIHPITHVKKQHRGMDISAPMGTPVVSAGDGVVSYAGYMDGFGNVIMITHSVKDQILTTVYGHLSSIGTKSGAHVGKGELIGAVGQTGLATGPHLHFEVHVGNFSGSGPSAVNPLHYVAF